MQENLSSESTNDVNSDISAMRDSQEISSEINAYNTELIKIQSKVTEVQEKYLRAKAETENVRRRSQEEIAKANKFAIEVLAKQLLPVIDSLEAAASDTSENILKIREGIDLTLRQLQSALDKVYVIPLNPIGEKFNPHLHQAISTVQANQEHNTIITVLQKGYKIADRVLRPALVTVAESKKSVKNDGIVEQEQNNNGTEPN